MNSFIYFLLSFTCAYLTGGQSLWLNAVFELWCFTRLIRVWRLEAREQRQADIRAGY